MRHNESIHRKHIRRGNTCEIKSSSEESPVDIDRFGVGESGGGVRQYRMSRRRNHDLRTFGRFDHGNFRLLTLPPVTSLTLVASGTPGGHLTGFSDVTVDYHRLLPLPLLNNTSIDRGRSKVNVRSESRAGRHFQLSQRSVRLPVGIPPLFRHFPLRRSFLPYIYIIPRRRGNDAYRLFQLFAIFIVDQSSLSVAARSARRLISFLC